jgi:ketosteroid isomerase-like protein
VVLEMEKVKWTARILALAVLALAAWWLGQRLFLTEELRLKRLIATMERAVEQPNFLRLADAIASDYNDDWGLDKSALLLAVRNYRQRYDAFVVHIHDLAIEVAPDRQHAQAVLIARVLAGSKTADPETELLTERLRLFFRKTDDGWKLTRAESPELKFE